MNYTVDYFIEKFDGIPEMDILRPVVQINDGKVLYNKDFSELGDTPKERILNALLLVKCGLWKESLGG